MAQHLQPELNKTQKGTGVMLKRFISDTSGATSIEYAMIAAFLSVAIVPLIAIIALRLVNNYESVSNILP
ncbi:MAG: Flp family type IVb pilin [Hyphomicrobiales bacterium]